VAQMDKNSLVEQYQGLERDLAALIGPNPFSASTNLRLERITQLLALLGNPHQAYPSVHVGGTSGKGSTSAMIASILTEAGYKTGLYMSPHLQIINERHQINRQVAATTKLSALFAEMKPAIDHVAATGRFGRPSYFEVQVALAFLLFQREAVDVAVVEVGLGGTLDATNVLDSAVSVLTNVGLDHTAILGHTVEAIARDKSGIIKSGQTVVSGVLHSEAQQIVADRCRTEKATLWQLGKIFDYGHANGSGFSLQLSSQMYPQLKLGMPGDFQMANAACAVAATRALPGFNVSEQSIRLGLQNVQIPGRLELMQREPTIILDGAHNPEKISASRRAIDRNYGDKRRIAVLSLKSDKAAQDVLPYVLQGTDILFVTRFWIEKSLWDPMSAEKLAQLAGALSPDTDIRIVEDPISALEQALEAAAPADLIWVTGSFYLAGNVREFWYPSVELLVQAEEGLSGRMMPESNAL